MTHHITSRKTYFFIYLILMVLLIFTVAVAYVDIGRWGTLVAISIAVVKALLILFFFMHLRHSDRIVWLFVLLAFAVLGTLLVLTLSDYLSRGWIGGV